MLEMEVNEDMFKPEYETFLFYLFTYHSVAKRHQIK